MKTPGDCGGLLVSTARVNEGYSRWLEWQVRAKWFMTMGDPLAWSALVALTGHPGGYMGDVKPLHPPGFDPSLIGFEYAGKGRTAP